jgi:hypothetical protein
MSRRKAVQLHFREPLLITISKDNSNNEFKLFSRLPTELRRDIVRIIASPHLLYSPVSECLVPLMYLFHPEKMSFSWLLLVVDSSRKKIR